MTARLGLALLCLGPAAAMAQSAVPDTLACIRANLPQQATLRLQAQVIDAQGVVATQHAQAVVRRRAGGSEISVRVESPADIAGTAYLIRRLPDDHSTYVYLPAAGQVQRLRGASGGTVLGTTLSADDLRHLLTGFDQGSVSLGPRGQVHDWSTKRVTIVAAPGADGPYDKIELEILEPACVVVESRLYRNNRLRRRITAAADSLRVHDGYHYAARLTATTAEDRLHTDIRILTLDSQTRVEDAWFAPDRFHQAGSR